MMALTNRSYGTSLQALLQGIVDTECTHSVTGINLDSRLVSAGDLFLACRGEQHDGAHYIKDAIAAGAVVVAADADALSPAESRSFSVPVIPVKALRSLAGKIIERFYDYPSHDLDIVGITGTNGKTSVAYMLARALMAYQEKEVGSIGTLGYGPISNLQDGPNTTPDPLTLHRLFSELRNESINSVVMEVSSHALHQGRVSGVDFNIGVFTNLSRDHLDYHVDMQRYAEAKSRLFLSENMQFAVLNADDEYGQQLQTELQKKLPVVSYGLVRQFSDEVLKTQAVVRKNTTNRLELDIRSPWGRGVLQSNLNGRFNAGNLLASLSVLCLLDVPFEQALEKLAQLDQVPGRLEYFRHKNSARIFVDYAHTPDALKQALLGLRAQEVGRLFCIFGCGGGRDPGKRPEMGQIAEQYADRLILTSDNPRGEDPQAIVDDIMAGLVDFEKVAVQLDRAAAIRSTILAADQSDIILIAGKGHETYQEIAGQRRPFSDRQLVRNVLGECR